MQSNHAYACIILGKHGTNNFCEVYMLKLKLLTRHWVTQNNATRSITNWCFKNDL